MSTKETFRERRRSGTTSENERHSPRLSVSSQQKRPRERERYTTESLRKHLFLVRFCFPAVLFTDRNSYTKERQRYSSLLLSIKRSFCRRRYISSSRITCICRLRDVSIIARAVLSVSRVRIHHGTRRGQNDAFKFLRAKKV